MVFWKLNLRMVPAQKRYEAKKAVDCVSRVKTLQGTLVGSSSAEMRTGDGVERELKGSMNLSWLLLPTVW